MAYLIILRKRVNGILSNKCQMEEYKINQIRWTCHLTAIKRTPLQKLTQLRTSLKQNRHLLKLGTLYILQSKIIILKYFKSINH